MSHLAIILQVVVFQFVPVTPTIIIFFEGNQFIIFAVIALSL